MQMELKQAEDGARRNLEMTTTFTLAAILASRRDDADAGPTARRPESLNVCDAPPLLLLLI